MALHFPRQEEIRLRAAPLAEVICQVRFPTILRISKEEPTELQERVRGRLPQLEVEQGLTFSLPRLGAGGGQQVSLQTAPASYRLSTTNGKTVLTLTQDFYAVTTTEYEHWQDFAELVSLANGAVQQVYTPAHATRIGLRFVNRLTLTNTKTETLDEMLAGVRPELTALLRSDAWSDVVEMRNRVSLVDGDLKFTLQTSLGREDNDPSFAIDFDCYQEGEFPFDKVLRRCNRYHEVIYSAFRWAIANELLDSFDPVHGEDR